MKSVYDVIIRPVITEQSMEDLDIKKFAFEVAKEATVHGKQKRTGRYPAGFAKTWKKAVVKLSEDSKNIEIFEGMA